MALMREHVWTFTGGQQLYDAIQEQVDDGALQRGEQCTAQAHPTSWECMEDFDTLDTPQSSSPLPQPTPMLTSSVLNVSCPSLWHGP
jgi:hypothetical protein